MRIVIDLQGAQAENRHRGIGRYALSVAQAIVRNRSDHEVLLVLNGSFPETIEPVRAAFEGLLPQANIHVWQAVGPLSHIDSTNSWRRKSAELVREAFIAQLDPSIVLVTSVFEGLVDDAVTSVGTLSRAIPTAAILYDLIPLIRRSPYLDNPAVAAWYENKLDHLRRCDLLLAISGSSRNEGIDHLGFAKSSITNISTAVDDVFRVTPLTDDERGDVQSRHGIVRDFIMYTGGIDYRKNIEGLIRAYAKLPVALRRAHQLAVVCSIQPADRERLLALAKAQGLGKDELVLTGFVSEHDLVALYNGCKVFVFPSFHEGFGLPALEAMACGRAVIAANTSSLPEVVGFPEALFDPFDDRSITQKLEQVLTDDTFRTQLERHSLEQAKTFSWDASALAAIAALEAYYAQHVDERSAKAVRRPRLAFVSPLPSERSGISDYSAELLPELARHYAIEVVVAQDTITTPWITANCPVRSVEWFRQHGRAFDRVIYHFGNSSFHEHMFSLLEHIPGVVVLHDFFVSGIVAHKECHGAVPNFWSQALYSGHGYHALRQRFHAKDTADVVWAYPCNYDVLRNAQGIIVHSNDACRLSRKWYGLEVGGEWSCIPLLRTPYFPTPQSRKVARSTLGLSDNAFVVCSFGLLGPSKLNHRLLNTWVNSALARDENCVLVFVGDLAAGDYARELQAIIKKSGSRARIKITGWADAGVFEQYLAAADIGVQLRTLSRGETSAAVLDCMNYGLATIVNSHGSMADLPEECIWRMDDEFTDSQLVEALETLWGDDQARRELGDRAQLSIRQQHSPRACAEQYFEAIEHFHNRASTSIPALVEAIAQLDAPGNGAELIELASAIDSSMPARFSHRQLLVDVSELVQRDARSGIQRVVRSILREWLLNPPDGYRVEPVYATTTSRGYRYARQFTLGFLECPSTVLADEPITYRAGDVFVGLDFQPEVVPAQAACYEAMRRSGVGVHFVVYDLLLLELSQYFPEGAGALLERWLAVVARSDGAVCISGAVRDRLAEWLEHSGGKRERPFKLDWFHLGADIQQSVPSTGLPVQSQGVLERLRAMPGFLMVGTVEPRKGHSLILSAFELLWAKGNDVVLVIVGKQGWMVEALVDRIRAHPELGKRLLWLEGISDEYLEAVYRSVKCLIAASEGEGFGLPLIEAAQHDLPIIARDLAVFREVAQGHAFYFSGKQPETVAQSLSEWLKLFEEGAHPVSKDMPWLTWEQSAQQLKCSLFK
ncbi:glycosyltransferase [Pseudomonas canadensis]|uniref:glycosyltransferase n=1 Tax=Pseudomonas TaxID=286 RepID=UPI003D6B5596